MDIPTTDIQGAIRRELDALQNTFTGGNYADSANFYTEDAMMLSPNRGVIQGNAAIREFAQQLKDVGIHGLRTDTITIESYGDVALYIGQYQYFDIDGKVISQGIDMTIWRQEEGRWKIFRDIWNVSAPAQEV